MAPHLPETTPVVGIPGTLCSPSIFAPLEHALASDTAFDGIDWMTGTGPWDLASVADRIATGIPRSAPAVVVGHSTGGAIALQLALDHPDALAGLVLVDTGAHMNDHGDVGAIIDALRENWGPELWASVLDRSFAEPLPRDARAGFLEYAASTPRQSALDVLTSQRATDCTSRLRRLTIPVAVVHGRLDPTRTLAQATAFAGGFPDASLTLLDCGHTPVFERPTETAAVVRGVIAAARERARL
ncbi:alpha/beta fold hydrolase [Frondihabitans cladoniiphilus]|uniref:AB hydrolase-1 domain-containing protein n=1 Tax=Frondihabitans cladoniiphilus TaxID=715785 RepID=A0ABP8W8K2_9MICO